MAREPMSIRFGSDDRAIMDALATRLGLSRGAVLRLALRSFDERLRATGDDGVEVAIAESMRSSERAVA